MKALGEILPKDDASSEAWFQKGVSVLEGKKQEREFEERLKKQMAHPAVFEPAFWFGIVMVVVGAWTISWSHELWLRIFWALMVITQFCSALEGASQKRMKAMLEWIEHQKTKEKQME
jgi:hypothetical protein